MGEGIGAAALEQHSGGQGIADLHLPASVRQGKGREGTGGARPIHQGPQNRFGLDHGDGGSARGSGTKKPQLWSCGNWCSKGSGCCESGQISRCQAGRG